MAGHLFLFQGDLTQICCDDWLLPCDGHAHVSRGWWRPWFEQELLAAGAWSRAHLDERPSKFVEVEIVLAIEPWDYDIGPRPWLMSVRGKDLRLERVRRVLHQVSTQPKDQRYLPKRSRRLVALPVFGTGYGGSRHESGKVLADLLPILQECVQQYDIDVVLVTRADGDFTAGQQARAGLGDAAFSQLSQELRNEADRLASLAAAGQLVLFLGAGVSAGARLPDWKDLLHQLAQDAGFAHQELEAFAQLDVLDQAEYLAQKLGGHVNVGQLVVNQLRQYRHHSLAHGLLASIPFTEAVTTNYDQLFEQACQSAFRELSILPYTPGGSSGRWLLKMHGCLDHPNDIVLTRQSYMRYAERNAALSGIVQAMLMTKHMLFAGFSLSDENFLRIVDSVRRAVQPYEHPHQRHVLGTATMLFASPLLQTLWKEEIHWICMESRNAPLSTEMIEEAKRRTEIFLDYLAFRASAQSHLLDPRFKHILNPQDHALKKLLMPLLQAPEAARQSAAWPHVEELLRQLGGRFSQTPPPRDPI